jgi:hypothetical protein
MKYGGFKKYYRALVKNGLIAYFSGGSAFYKGCELTI